MRRIWVNGLSGSWDIKLMRSVRPGDVGFVPCASSSASLSNGARSAERLDVGFSVTSQTYRRPWTALLADP